MEDAEKGAGYSQKADKLKKAAREGIGSGKGSKLDKEADVKSKNDAQYKKSVKDQ